MACIALVLTLLSATLFNSTLKENSAEMQVVARGFAFPLVAAASVISRIDPPMPHWLRFFGGLKPLVVLTLTAVIYSGLDPEFGFNERSLGLLLSLGAAIGVVTCVYEGGQVLLSERRFGVPAALRFYPLAIAVAAASVILSRLIALHPGIIFGFVASAALLTQSGLNRRQAGVLVFVPMLGLLLASVIAFLLITPFRELTRTEASWWAPIPETAAIAVFVGGVQGVLFSLIPLTFNDGERVWQWNRVAWLTLALPASFLFFYIMVNDGGASEFSDSDTRTLLIVCGVLLVLSGGLWSFFRSRRNLASK